MAILLDFNRIVIASISVAAKSNIEINDVTVRHMVFNMILSYNKKFKKDYGELVLCCDSKNIWRKDIYPYYKAKRKESRSKSDLPWDLIYGYIDTITDELNKFFPYRVIRIDRAEADDIIGVLSKELSTNEVYYTQSGLVKRAPNVLIVSVDHDMKQLLKWSNVRIYNPSLKKFVSHNNPSMYLKEHIIRGDSGDGVPNFLSDDDVFVNDDKRQSSIYETSLEVWLNQTKEEICEGDPDKLANWERNEKMVNLELVPENIQNECISMYNEQAGKGRSRIFNYLVKHKLKNIVDDMNLL